MTAPLDSAPAPRPRKRTVALFVFLAVAALLGIVGLIYAWYASRFEETDDAFVDGNIVTVSPQIAGRIAVIHIQDNQDVQAGLPLVEIDPTDYLNAVHQAQAALLTAQARVDVARTNLDLIKATTAAALVQAQAGVAQAQADVAHAQAGIERAQATVRGAEAQVQSAQADVDAAQAEATRRQADWKRYEALDPRAVSQQQRDAARATADSAAAQLVAAQKRHTAAEAQVAQEQSKQAEAQATLTQAQAHVAQAQGVLQTAQTAPQQIATAEAQLKTAQAGVEQAQTALEMAQQQLTYTKILAPVSGRITRKSVQLGQVVEAGRNLLSLVPPDMWVTANFKETQLTHMHAGQKVDIRVDMYPGRLFAGHIDSFQSGTGARFSLMPPENATGNYVKVVQRVPVKILFDGDAGAALLLGPGMSVVPRVWVGGQAGAPAPIARTGAP